MNNKYDFIAEKTYEYLFDNNIVDLFIGSDVSIEESLKEYGFIYSEQLKLCLYMNEYNNLDVFRIDSGESLMNEFKDRIKDFGEDDILNFCDIDSLDDFTSLPDIVQSFASYYGIQESPLGCNAYDSGFEDFSEVKGWLDRNLFEDRYYYLKSNELPEIDIIQPSDIAYKAEQIGNVVSDCSVIVKLPESDKPIIVIKKRVPKIN